MSLTPEHRSLLMRANRLLGANLVEVNLVKIDSLEAANERLLELVSEGDYRRSSVLGILSYELQVLNEADVLQYVVDEHGLGMVDLRSYDVPDDLRASVDLGACWSTWTVPFDREEEIHFVATAYYLSPAVRTYWEKLLGGPIVWYGTSMELISEFLESVEEARGKGTAAQPSK